MSLHGTGIVQNPTSIQDYVCRLLGAGCCLSYNDVSVIKYGNNFQISCFQRKVTNFSIKSVASSRTDGTCYTDRMEWVSRCIYNTIQSLNILIERFLAAKGILFFEIKSGVFKRVLIVYLPSFLFPSTSYLSIFRFSPFQLPPLTLSLSLANAKSCKYLVSTDVQQKPADQPNLQRGCNQILANQLHRKQLKGKTLASEIRQLTQSLLKTNWFINKLTPKFMQKELTFNRCSDHKQLNLKFPDGIKGIQGQLVAKIASIV